MTPPMGNRSRSVPLILGGAALLAVPGCHTSGGTGPPGPRPPYSASPAPPAPAGPDRGARIRLDQVGYLPDDSKRAYLMTAPTGRIRFKVENARGRTVLTGTPGRRTGSWNAAFPSVRVLDLTRLTDRGTYRVAVSGPGVRAHSPGSGSARPRRCSGRCCPGCCGSSRPSGTAPTSFRRCSAAGRPIWRTARPPCTGRRAIATVNWWAGSSRCPAPRPSMCPAAGRTRATS
ncbi:hypothetical protein LUX57_07210 [Actinomadura madurae]|nr:cellulase N-terminal Ig-like domain-containing protein [Actinomadura madurae]MCP9964951.1 hypothetical protein [Actinomadura madurae]